MCTTLFFLGGVRSGKSAAALRWAEACSPNRLFVAPCRVTDEEMRARVARHKAARGATWRVCEEPRALVETLARHNMADTGVLVLDCLSSWVANCLEDGLSACAIVSQAQEIADQLAHPTCAIGVVSLEVGLGSMPMHPLARTYGDILGECNQILAGACTTVLFFAAGLPLLLKGHRPAML